MGNSKIQGIVANATPYDVFYSVRTSQLILDKRRYSTNFKVNGDVSATTSLQQCDLGASHTAHASNQLHRVQDASQIRVNRQSASRQGLLLQPSNENQRLFFCCWVRTPENDIMVIKNLLIRDEADIRVCIWIGNGEVRKTRLEKQPNVWRFAAGCGEFRNYPKSQFVNFVCNQCGKGQRCTPGCEEDEKYRD